MVGRKIGSNVTGKNFVMFYVLLSTARCMYGWGSGTLLGGYWFNSVHHNESGIQINFGSWGQKPLRSCNWLQLLAANGLTIPFAGNLELDVDLCG